MRGEGQGARKGDGGGGEREGRGEDEDGDRVGIEREEEGAGRGRGEGQEGHGKGEELFPLGSGSGFPSKENLQDFHSLTFQKPPETSRPELQSGKLRQQSREVRRPLAGRVAAAGPTPGLKGVELRACPPS